MRTGQFIMYCPLPKDQNLNRMLNVKGTFLIDVASVARDDNWAKRFRFHILWFLLSPLQGENPPATSTTMLCPSYSNASLAKGGNSI